MKKLRAFLISFVLYFLVPVGVILIMNKISPLLSGWITLGVVFCWGSLAFDALGKWADRSKEKITLENAETKKKDQIIANSLVILITGIMVILLILGAIAGSIQGLALVLLLGKALLTNWWILILFVLVYGISHLLNKNR